MKHTQLEQKKNTYTHLVNKKEHTRLVKEKENTWWDCQGNIETHSFQRNRNTHILKRKWNTHVGYCQGNIETHGVLKRNEEHNKHTQMQKKEYTHMCAHTVVGGRRDNLEENLLEPKSGLKLLDICLVGIPWDVYQGLETRLTLGNNFSSRRKGPVVKV